jgi:hypothetical protein
MTDADRAKQVADRLDDLLRRNIPADDPIWQSLEISRDKAPELIANLRLVGRHLAEKELLAARGAPRGPS